MPRKRIIVGLLLVFIEYSQTGWYPISAIEKENNEMGNLYPYQYPSLCVNWSSPFMVLESKFIQNILN